VPARQSASERTWASLRISLSAFLFFSRMLSEERGATVVIIDFPPKRITVNGHTGFAELGEMRQGEFKIQQRFRLSPLD